MSAATFTSIIIINHTPTPTPRPISHVLHKQIVWIESHRPGSYHPPRTGDVDSQEGMIQGEARKARDVPGCIEVNLVIRCGAW